MSRYRYISTVPASSSLVQALYDKENLLQGWELPDAQDPLVLVAALISAWMEEAFREVLLHK
ncbi:hypothetical protein H920_16782 [Fukomys damarensis]|uniref:Uncharacterized protein n=1 Tax=Fukomys damarensis TaxID=885580 RepID=A0A091CRI0_FUKDA|nr:hypothetical protein H920_16782 [Fukomys damarensis]